MQDIIDFFSQLFQSDAFMPRWKCGKWSEFHGWMYVLADLTVFFAYMAIPMAMYYFIRKRWGQVPFSWLLWLFIAFISLCGLTHLIDAIIFWVPMYRLNAIILFATAIVSLATVAGIVKVIPLALEFKSPDELKQSEQKFRELLESAPDAMVIVNDQGLMSLINAQTENLFGYSRNQLLGKPVEMLIPNRYRHTHPKHRQGFSKMPKARPMGAGRELTGLRKDGSEFPVEISLSPLNSEGESLVSAAIRDITDRTEQHKELLKARSLSAKNEELERFAHVTAHNIRSPASNLSSLIKILKNETDQKEIDRIVELLGKSVEVLMRTLDDVSEVLVSTNAEEAVKEISFSEVMDDVVLELRDEIITSKSNLEVDFSAARDVTYPRNHVHNILLNLVSNAIRYREPSRENHIQISTGINEGKVLLTVRDNGIGINLERYGDSMFKLYKTFHQNEESRGVGLFLIKNQLKSLDGDVKVSSTVGVGTEFVVTFGELKKTR